MKKNDYYFSRYILHDTSINEISQDTGKLYFYINQGVYWIDVNNENESFNKTNSCKIEISIDNLDVDKIYQHIVVKKIYKSKIKEIEFNTFLKLLKYNKEFKIDVDYYSFFAKSLLLKGRVGKYEMELVITEIKDVVFGFQN